MIGWLRGLFRRGGPRPGEIVRTQMPWFPGGHKGYAYVESVHKNYVLVKFHPSPDATGYARTFDEIEEVSANGQG